MSLSRSLQELPKANCRIVWLIFVKFSRITFPDRASSLPEEVRRKTVAEYANRCGPRRDSAAYCFRSSGSYDAATLSQQALLRDFKVQCAIVNGDKVHQAGF